MRVTLPKMLKLKREIHRCVDKSPPTDIVKSHATPLHRIVTSLATPLHRFIVIRDTFTPYCHRPHIYTVLLRHRLHFNTVLLCHKPHLYTVLFRHRPHLYTAFIKYFCEY
jgi:hypothetical protein